MPTEKLTPEKFCARPDQTCDFYSKNGCCNGLVQQSGGQERILSMGICAVAKVKNVFGTMEKEEFTADKNDPDGRGILGLALFDKIIRNASPPGPIQGST